MTAPTTAIAAEVVMYRTPFCPYCMRAEALLRRKGVAVREVDVSDDPAARRWLLEVSQQRTVPQIFINGVLDQLLAEPPVAVSPAP